MDRLRQPDIEGIVLDQTTPEMQRLAASVGAAVQSCRLSGMSAEQAFTVLAVTCGFQAADGVSAAHARKMCNVLIEVARQAA
jgi:hypothetical protein